jgi:hypothetical protein
MRATGEVSGSAAEQDIAEALTTSEPNNNSSRIMRRPSRLFDACINALGYIELTCRRTLNRQ